MKLKPIKRKVVVQEEIIPPTPEKKPRKSSKDNKLPSDEYKPMLPPKRVLAKESVSSKDPSVTVKQYLEISVKRLNDDAGLPHIFIQMYQESPFYTGYLKGKSIHLAVDSLQDLIDELSDLGEECEKNNITTE